tara:strand:- start:253 stop:1806 length:1554 start_codon:yes stop_codon:yes gene_type:complete
MGGGLIQLVAYGAQDIYLTGNPQITFFKVVYRRHTNFSIEAIRQTLAGNAAANSTQTCTISRNGDLVHKVWIEDSNSSCTDGEIYDYIKKVDCEIGGQLIDRQTGDWNAIWWNLTTPESKVNGLRNTFIGFSGADESNTFYYPLNFWFCRNIGLALPLIALQYHEINLKITYGSSIISSPSPNVWIDYIYLDTDERRRFAQVSHEYLIEQIQRDTFNGTQTTFNLNFNHPVKELIWVNDTTGCTETGSTFAPIRCNENVIDKESGTPYANADNTSMRLVLNGADRFTKRKMKYFKTCQPLQHHTRCPSVGKRFTISVSASVKDLADASKGIPLYYATKPVRLISANYAIIVTDSGITMGLYSSDGGSDTNLFDTSSSAKLLTNTPSSGTSHGFNAPFTLVSTDNIICIPAGKIIGLKPSSGADTLEVMITMEFEELPLLIGGSISEDIGNIYCYSFALKPEEHQPSGTCNFSRIDSAQLIFDNNPGGSSSIPALKVFAINYNVLRIVSGMGGLAYSN